MAPNEKSLAEGIEAVLDGRSVRKSARLNGVSKDTLRRRIMDVRPHSKAHENQQRLSATQEDELTTWILRQESIGYAPTRRQVRLAAAALLELQGDSRPLGKDWVRQFIKRQHRLKTKRGLRIEYSRVNAATPTNIHALFDAYDDLDWIKPENRHNADEVGFMEGKGADGLVVGSAELSPKSVGIKSNEKRTWTTVVECISAAGTKLDPLVIFQAKTIQDQWFSDEILAEHPTWKVTHSEKGWTSNAIGLEWLEKVFIPLTQPADVSDARLLVVDGHGSHCTDDFMIHSFLNNIYILFLPAHSSRVTQPLDRGVFSALKTAYRHFLGDLAALNDSAPVGKLNFLNCYSKARARALSPSNILAGWRVTGLWPKDRSRCLENPHVATAARQEEPVAVVRTPEDPPTPKHGREAKDLLRRPGDSPSTRRVHQKVANALDHAASQLVMQQKRIAELAAQLEAAKPKKRKTVRENPNERFTELA